MNTSSRLHTGLRAGFFILALAFVFSCGGSGGGSSSSTDSTVAVQAATRNISSIIQTNADGIGAVGGDSQALASLLEPLGIVLTDNAEQGLSTELTDFLEVLTDANSAIITRNGNTISIRPAASQSCNDLATSVGFAQDSELYSSCIDAMASLLIVIQVDTDESGTLSVNFDGHTLVSLQYSPTQLVVSLNITSSFSALQSLLAVLDPSSALELPQTLVGEVQLTLRDLGEQHGSIRLAVTQAIQLIDTTPGQEININLQPADWLFVEADGVAGTATVSSTLNTISAMFPVDTTALGNVPGELTLDGAVITLNVTDGGAGMNGNVSIGPLDIDINNLPAVDFLLDPEFSVDPVTGAITLDTALTLNLSVTDIYGVLTGQTGTLTVDAPQGTVFTEVVDSIFVINAGSMLFTGTGDFVAMSGSLGIGDCFGADGSVTCPVVP